MNELVAFVDRWEEFGEPPKTELIYFQCIALHISGLHDKRLGALYCVIIVARTLVRGISKGVFAKHGVPF